MLIDIHFEKCLQLPIERENPRAALRNQGAVVGNHASRRGTGFCAAENGRGGIDPRRYRR